MASKEYKATWEKWAHLRFSVIAGLLASPPPEGKLGEALTELSKKQYRHPTRKGRLLSLSKSTIERWYYLARNADDPIKALGRRVRSDAGRARAMKPQLVAELAQQYRQHPRWSYQLHCDNLAALTVERSVLGPMPSYSTVCREMKRRGWVPRKRLRRNATPGQRAAYERLEKREVRSFEREFVHALWHSDFHTGRRRVVDSQGCYHTPHLLAFMDDCSRVCCHAQWYLAESADNFIHGQCQAFAKRGLPREEMTDNGGAMVAQETLNGFARLGVEHRTILAYSPYQNGKQECFWSQVEGRLMPMLEDVEPLTLEFLNLATQAWMELEYNRRRHDELGCAPLDRLLAGPDVSRKAPDAQAMRLAFSLLQTRTQRRSDGTVSIGGVRFEVPSRFRHRHKLHVRYQSWDLTVAWLVDERSGEVLGRLLPLDKASNADGRRRSLEPPLPFDNSDRTADREPVPPLMRKLLDDYQATGLPPAYLPKPDYQEKEDERQ